MDKKKFRVAVLVPVLVVVVVLGGIIYGVLQSGSVNGIEPSADATVQGEVVESAQGETRPGAASGSMPYDPAMEGPQGDPAACDFASLVGLRVPEALEQVRPLRRPFRVLAPGDAATQDFSPERINLQIDESGTVATVTCG